jgi:hypothetical protein
MRSASPHIRLHRLDELLQREGLRYYVSRGEGASLPLSLSVLTGPSMFRKNSHAPYGAGDL